jgi:hypothetical protein
MSFFQGKVPKLLLILLAPDPDSAKTEIFSLSKPMARNSPTFANLTKVSLPEKFSLKPKNIKVWLTK